MNRFTYDMYARQARRIAADREEYEELMAKLEEVCDEEEARREDE